MITLAINKLAHRQRNIPIYKISDMPSVHVSLLICVTVQLHIRKTGLLLQFLIHFLLICWIRYIVSFNPVTGERTDHMT